MKTRAGLILAVLLAISSRAEGLFPAGDPWAESLFGVWRSEPIWTGMLFVDGCYVDAPYVVEQRGFGIFVNGELCGKGLDDKRYSDPENQPLHEDPGMPADITASTPYATARYHPVTMAKFRYWRTLRLPTPEYVKRLIAYWRALPCTSKVEEIYEGEELHLVIHDHLGSAERVVFSYPKKGFMTLLALPAPETIMLEVVQQRDFVHGLLSSGGLILVANDHVTCMTGGLATSRDGRKVVEVLASNQGLAEKARVVKELRFDDSDRPDVLSRRYGAFFTNFCASAQFWKRMEDDDAWRAEAQRSYKPQASGVIKEPGFAKKSAAAAAAVR